MLSKSFDSDEFKSSIWQKKPAVFRGMFPNFVDPLSADELAGLALEPGVDSRIVQSDHGKWNLIHGPFEAYDTLGDSHWSLLVQAVNEHFPPAQKILNAFSWMPSWRLDDLMVSFSTPEGGVGAHIDQYDVFIIQGKGERRWSVGPRGEYAVQTPHPDLKQISGFEPILDEVLKSGDVIYIPAGFPHKGVSLTDSFNYSIGFRAPSQGEFLSALADYALEFDQLQQRYTDTKESLAAQKNKPDVLPQQAVDQIQELLRSALEDKTLIQKVASKLLSTNPRPPLQFWPEQSIQSDQLLSVLNNDSRWLAAPGLRWLYTDPQDQNNDPEYIYIQGSRFAADLAVHSFFERISKEEGVESQWIFALAESSEQLSSILTWMYNEGLIVCEDDLEEEED
ncbi:MULTISPECIES: cupin domain-containing protein [Gammaproteobacteria]|uniref:cupin domain-containing protein n=1 Tax=Gammaproteobacteria TaxID=1236 RepID=UPI000DD09FE3|nr:MULTISPECIES: cupin domain-containing protein [Gammaproteobacteria]RTE87256.1 cupin domain-containing protein [Aliidiomarina sp. B3213]TCZ92957.1 cupin domain-containing protein [Lysobacter sp. N42]